MSAPVDYTNDVRTIAALDNFMSINNAVDLDLFGQSKCRVRRNQASAVQADSRLRSGRLPVQGAERASSAAPSTFQEQGWRAAVRILPTLKGFHRNHDTRKPALPGNEYGKVNLKGLATWQKMRGYHLIAHPQFRDQLIKGS